VLIEACEKMENETIKRNREHLANNRVGHFSNAGLGDQWYALHLEEPKVKMQRQSPYAKPAFLSGAEWSRRMSEAGDRLELCGLEVACVIGDLPEERDREQRLTVDVEQTLDLGPAAGATSCGTRSTTPRWPNRSGAPEVLPLSHDRGGCPVRVGRLPG
jgi:hypothetical protein